jgi:hypothetical protein
VFATGAVCWWVAPELRAQLRERNRRDHQTYPPEVWAFLDALDEGAADWAERRFNAPVEHSTARDVPSLKLGVDGREITVTEAAEMTCKTDKSLYARIARGTLPARRDEKGRLWIRVENLDVE